MTKTAKMPSRIRPLIRRRLASSSGVNFDFGSTAGSPFRLLLLLLTQPTPVPGIPTDVVVRPVVDFVSRTPLPPTLTDPDFFPTVTRTPGAIFMLFLNRIAMSSRMPEKALNCGLQP